MSPKTTTSTRPVLADGVMSPDWNPIDGEPSWQSRCITALLRLFRVKRQMASAAFVKEHVRRLASRPAPYQPTGLGRGIRVSLTHWAGWPVYHTASSKSPDAGDYVVFLHGGGYINEIVRAHWRFVAYLNRNAGVRCIVPIYPVAPGGTAKTIVPTVGEQLRQLLDEAGSQKVTLMGNSAGAGMALAVAQWLRDGGHPQPHRLVLVSPGLDATVGRPEQAQIAARDPVNDIPGMREAVRIYAGELDVSHPYVSPLNGDLRGLAPMLVFAGTDDLLYPDSIALATKARAAGVAVELHLRRGQPHNYAAMPTPEGREARETIVRTLTQ
jgi:epsilon-lactone hydrolase